MYVDYNNVDYNNVDNNSIDNNSIDNSNVDNKNGDNKNVDNNNLQSSFACYICHNFTVTYIIGACKELIKIDRLKMVEYIQRYIFDIGSMLLCK